MFDVNSCGAASLIPFHDFLLRDTASAFGPESATQNRYSCGNLVVTRKRGRNQKAENLGLHVAATFTVARRATAATGQARCARLAANFAIDAANTNLSGATAACWIAAAVGAAKSAAEYRF